MALPAMSLDCATAREGTGPKACACAVPRRRHRRRPCHPRCGPNWCGPRAAEMEADPSQPCSSRRSGGGVAPATAAGLQGRRQSQSRLACRPRKPCDTPTSTASWTEWSSPRRASRCNRRRWATRTANACAPLSSAHQKRDQRAALTGTEPATTPMAGGRTPQLPLPLAAPPAAAAASAVPPAQAPPVSHRRCPRTGHRPGRAQTRLWSPTCPCQTGRSTSAARQRPHRRFETPHQWGARH